MRSGAPGSAPAVAAAMGQARADKGTTRARRSARPNPSPPYGHMRMAGWQARNDIVPLASLVQNEYGDSWTGYHGQGAATAKRSIHEVYSSCVIRCVAAAKFAACVRLPTRSAAAG